MSTLCVSRSKPGAFLEELQPQGWIPVLAFAPEVRLVGIPSVPDSLTEWEIRSLGRSYGIERKRRGKDTALLNFAFLLDFFFFNAGEFQIPVSSRVGPVLHSAKVRFHFPPPLSAPSQSYPKHSLSSTHTQDWGKKKGRWDTLTSALARKFQDLQTAIPIL